MRELPVSVADPALPGDAAFAVDARVIALGGGRATLRGHLAIARLDHWIKNVFVLPGFFLAILLGKYQVRADLVPRLLIGMLAIGLVASSNYTLNEILDAPYDRTHPTKRRRPVASGLVNVPLGYLQWIALAAVGGALGVRMGREFFAALSALWIMGIVYNVRPLRSKDVPYLDVLSEAINNPIRLAAGWYLVAAHLLPPTALLLSYWFVGCYFMAIKRLSEIRQLSSDQRRQYRRSLACFTEDTILVSVVFYASAAMLFFGAFLMRYRLELVLSFPFVAVVMAIYLSIAFRPDSAAQNPEKLYREPWLMLSVAASAAAMLALLYFDMPWLRNMFPPTAIGPVQ